METLLRAREEIKRLAGLLAEIEEKFKIKVPVGIYRSSLVSSYLRRDHRVEYRVWAHSMRRGAYPYEVLAEWLEKLIEARPPNQPALFEIITDRSNWGYEEDRLISPEDMAPPGAELDLVYGHAIYDAWQYLFEQLDDDLVEIASGTAPTEVRVRLKHFGIEITEEDLKKGRRLRHRAAL